MTSQLGAYTKSALKFAVQVEAITNDMVAAIWACQLRQVNGPCALQPMFAAAAKYAAAS